MDSRLRGLSVAFDLTRTGYDPDDVMAARLR
jgi:hypothetical protein